MSMKLRYFLPLFLGVFALLPSSAHAYNVEYQSNTIVNSQVSGGYFGTSDPLADWTGNGEAFPYYTGNYTFSGDCGTGCRISPFTPTVAELQALNQAGVGSIASAYSYSQTYYPQSCDSPTGLCHFAISDTAQFNAGGFPNVIITGSLILFDVSQAGVITAVNPGPPPPDPAIGDLNEVVRYWPGFNYATSTGTTTVGAQFSIAHPEWIDGVGIELSGSTDTSASTTIAYVSTLYTATTTVATSSTFSLTTDYNFVNGGYYTIQAFFIQNGRRVYNTTQGTLLINYTPPNITVGNDGQFHFNGTTTVATSTLEALHFDCGDTVIVSSICKLAIAFVIPDPSAIQAVKTNFSAILVKAPFSFFTDSKTLLDAFQLGTASSGGTFSLTFYGQSAPIISTSTASSIGLSSTPINALKALETIGLWLLLAWYLYWRIASIFGV